jgi:hypothetical protein
VKQIRKVKVISNPLILLHILFISQLHGITKPVFPGYLNFKFCNRYSVFNFAVFCYFRIGKSLLNIVQNVCCYQILLLMHLAIAVCVELY